MRVSSSRSAVLLAIGILVAGCGGDGGSSTGPTTPDPGDLTAVVGRWAADSILVSPKANPSISREIVSEDHVVFTLRIETSGSYVASLTAFGQSKEETGSVRVQGNVLTFLVRTPVATTSHGTFSRSGARLILEGDLVLDFNQDGTPDDLDTRFVLSPS